MVEDVILPNWKTLLPAEKLGNTKESLVGQVKREMLRGKKRKRRRQGLKPDEEQEEKEGAEGTLNDPEARSGKIVDITI